MQLDTLQQQFSQQSHVTFRQNAAGVILLEIKNLAAEASISLQGGHILRWKPVDQQHSVIWTSSQARIEPDTSIRGGVPICWPWFGAHPEHGEFPAHGFVRTAEWDVIAVEEISAQQTKVVIGLRSQPKYDGFCPHPFLVQLEVQVGKQLQMALVTENQSQQDWVVTQALHTYFEVSDLSNVEVLGLEGLAYLDKVEEYARKKQQGSIQPAGEEIDRVYLASVQPVSIVDKGYRRRIHIEKAHSQTIVVWNPGAQKGPKMADMTSDGYRQMICVETVNAADEQIRLACGARYSMETTYRVESL